MNTTDTSNETNLRQFEKLSSSELAKLKRKVRGYGNFRKTAIDLNLSETTLRDVINRGHGQPETIAKVRGVQVLEPEVSTR